MTRSEQEMKLSLREIKQAVMHMRKRLENVEEGESFVVKLQVSPAHTVYGRQLVSTPRDSASAAGADDNSATAAK